ncbi:MAG: 16S rRNA (guanine(966)-N(2))-methyltransferase RsmD [Clostridiales bacterium]|nr:16S rRNA (guanine(966)-N(2))-methyltransferase RsmD [Clostridiales bacterium]
MRIIAGKYKYKRLFEFNVPTTRPTSDKVKESLFDILGDLDDTTCLDLFAGTGALGLEALSRGAKFCYFVEQNLDIYKILVKNFQNVGVEKNSVNVLRCDYLKALKGYKSKNLKFDVIFIDPPYKLDLAEKAIDFILDNNLLNENGLICWEHDKGKLEKIEHYNIIKHKKYGSIYLTVLNDYAK